MQRNNLSIIILLIIFLLVTPYTLAQNWQQSVGNTISETTELIDSLEEQGAIACIIVVGKVVQIVNTPWVGATSLLPRDVESVIKSLPLVRNGIVCVEFIQPYAEGAVLKAGAWVNEGWQISQPIIIDIGSEAGKAIVQAWGVTLPTVGKATIIVEESIRNGLQWTQPKVVDLTSQTGQAISQRWQSGRPVVVKKVQQGWSFTVDGYQFIAPHVVRGVSNTGNFIKNNYGKVKDWFR